MNMKRQVAVVTGASRGIGRQIAITLAQQGYDIAVNYRSEPQKADEVCEIAKSYGVRAEKFQADIGEIDQLERMYKQIDEVFDEINVLVNNAGISNEVYFLDANEQDFDRMTKTDWKGLYFSSQMAVKRMIAKNIKGVVINISSNQVDGCWPRATIYAPTKAAVSKFTKNAAMELIKYGIRMVAVAPGYTDVGWAADDIRMEAAQRLPMKRFATVQEVAEGVAYLASSHAAYITGTTLTIDGGALLPVVAENDFIK